MKTRTLLTIACLAACSLPAQAPPPAAQNESPSTKKIREMFYAATNNIRRAADNMPENNYAFKPTPDMRSFGELLAHIADVQSRICQSTLRDKKPTKEIDDTAKSDIQRALSASFDECYEAFSELSAENQDQLVPTPAGELPRIVALTMVLGHDSEEYGSMQVYLRMKGIAAPPTNEISEREYKGK